MKSTLLLILAISLATLAALVPYERVARDEQTLLMTVWGMPFEDMLFRDIYARGFEEKHPGWTVEYQRHTDVLEKYKAWHVQSRGADVMRIEIRNYHTHVRLGTIAPLDEFIDHAEYGLSEEDISDFIPAVWELLEIDGSIYALPTDNAQYGVYYNPALFDEYNRAHPDQSLEYPHADWTWDDFRHAVERLTKRDERGNITQYGVSFDLWSFPFMTFLKQAGGKLWDEAQTTTLINSPEGIEAMAFIGDLIPPDAPARSPELTDSAASPAEWFKIGRVAMLLDGSWRAPNIELSNPDLDFAIAPLPHHRDRAVVSGSVLWAVGAHSDNRLMAWRMIKDMTSREGSLTYWNALRVAPPARLSIINSDEFRSTDGIIDSVTGERRANMPAGRYDDRAAWLSYAITPHPETGERPGFVAVAPYQTELERLIGQALVEVVRGDKTPKQALDDAVASMHAIIDRDRRLRGQPPVQR